MFPDHDVGQHHVLDDAVLADQECGAPDAEPQRPVHAEALDGLLVDVGTTMITMEWTDWRDGWFWWIQSVWVEPDCRRQGVFGVLYRHVRELARTDPDVRGLRLYVEGANQRAQDTYGAMGMVMTGYRVMEEEF